MAQRTRRFIEQEAITVAYAMSRLDDKFLQAFGFPSWKAAFAQIGSQLGIPPASVKNLRDEFDPVHPNARHGWHKRPLRQSRQRVLGNFCDSSDEAIIDIVKRLLAGDKTVQEMIIAPMAATRDPVTNVAERLRTGRLAEEYFMANCENICGLPLNSLRDCRDQACGFDFGVHGEDSPAIEVKGLKKLRGAILFTDREWNQANRRQSDYWLVVVGGLDRQPRANLIKHPAAALSVTSSIRNAIAVSWTAKVTVHSVVE